MSLPRLNLRSRRVLLPLLYRALAGRADAAQSQLTQRRIEHLQAEGTELAKAQSELRARVGITRDKATAARQSATQAGLDLRIFMESYVEPPAGGLFKPRLSLEQRQAQLHKAELEALAIDGAAAAKSREAEAQAVATELSKVEAAVEVNRSARSELAELLAEQLAADILGALCAAFEDSHQRLYVEGAEGGSSAGSAGLRPALESLLAQPALAETRALCSEQLAGLRRSVRGDLMVALLSVLLELLAPPAGLSASAAARRALIDVTAILQQHRDPAARLLECLIRWWDGEALGLADIGIYSSGHFSYPALHRLYELLRVLAGLGYDEGELERDDAPPEHGSTLIMLHEYIRFLQPSENWEPLSPELLEEFARDGDVFQRLLAASLLLQCSEVDRLVESAEEALYAVNAQHGAGKLRQPDPPLLARLDAGSFHAWPARRQAWLSSLGCHFLLAAQVKAPAFVFEQWQEESYGWVKDDLYWWTLSTLKQDPALLRNLRGDELQLFILA